MNKACNEESSKYTKSVAFLSKDAFQKNNENIISDSVFELEYSVKGTFYLKELVLKKRVDGWLGGWITETKYYFLRVPWKEYIDQSSTDISAQSFKIGTEKIPLYGKLDGNHYYVVGVIYEVFFK